MNEKPVYRVTLRIEKSSTIPPVVLLRKFLKMALRFYGLRATVVEEVPAGGYRPPVNTA